MYTSHRLFWSAIKFSYSDTKQNKANCVPPRIWKQHFEKLLSSCIRKANPHLGPLANSKVDIPFSTEELSSQLKNLKENKASSSSVTNNMLKANIQAIAPHLTELFNRILHSRVYPKSWRTSNIISLFK